VNEGLGDVQCASECFHIFVCGRFVSGESSWIRVYGGTQFNSWLRHYAMSSKVVVLRPIEFIEFFNLSNPLRHTIAMEFTLLLTEMSTRNRKIVFLRSRALTP
jgi:hypothetical protein